MGPAAPARDGARPSGADAADRRGRGPGAPGRKPAASARGPGAVREVRQGGPSLGRPALPGWRLPQVQQCNRCNRCNRQVKQVQQVQPAGATGGTAAVAATGETTAGRRTGGVGRDDAGRRIRSAAVQHRPTKGHWRLSRSARHFREAGRRRRREARLACGARTCSVGRCVQSRLALLRYCDQAEGRKRHGPAGRTYVYIKAPGRTPPLHPRPCCSRVPAVGRSPTIEPEARIHFQGRAAPMSLSLRAFSLPPLPLLPPPPPGARAGRGPV
jgi:hypothetical protein